MRAGLFEDFREDSGVVQTIAPPGAPFKLPPYTYDGNSDLDENLVHFEQMVMFIMRNEPIKATIFVWQ